MKNVWFQQNGTTAHTANDSVNVFRRMFPGRLISCFGNVPWPPRSPNLSICDFFLWGYLESHVYTNRPQNLDELKNVIIQEIAPIPKEMLACVMQDFQWILENCIQEDGHHLADIIFQN